MKNKSYCFFILLVFILLIIGIHFIKAQGALINDKEKYFITKFDADLMAKKYLSNYKLVRKRAHWNCGKEYAYRNNDNKVNIFKTIGLHSSIEDAESIANAYLNGISIRMNEGTDKEVSIGDKFWWWSPDQNTNDLILLLIRKNALILMGCSHIYVDLRKLALEIDEGIIMGDRMQ